ncbi:hypothetical protein KC318_g44 [Hortaea werneckii]|nr:hypothetical protein KC334_g41 [Hortaea werneckii]KAI7676774.1 hypothetical protein KC318_g44 [Hortaea werneckii]
MSSAGSKCQVSLAPGDGFLQNIDRRRIPTITPEPHFPNTSPSRSHINRLMGGWKASVPPDIFHSSILFVKADAPLDRRRCVQQA